MKEKYSAFSSIIISSVCPWGEKGQFFASVNGDRLKVEHLLKADNKFFYAAPQRLDQVKEPSQNAISVSVSKKLPNTYIF